MIHYPLIRHITGANPTRRVVWTVTQPGPGRTETFVAEAEVGLVSRWEPIAVVRLGSKADAEFWVGLFDYTDQPPRL